MSTEIGAKLKVEGESTYSRAMREAAKNTKSLDSELKLAQAQFRATGDAEELMASRGRILGEQLKQQETAVKTAQEMLAKLASAGYDANSQKVLEWRAKLAQAQEQVLNINQAIENNMNGLDATGRAYTDAGQSMQELGQDATTLQADLQQTGAGAATLKDALEKLGVRFGWEGLSDTLHSINQAIDKSITKAVQLGKALWDAGVDATVWADDLITTATQMSISTETLQRWQYASRFVDTSVETIAGAQNKLTQGMSKSGKSLEDWMATLATMGVRVRDSHGDLRSTNDIFWDTIGYLSTLENESQREALAMEVLGKSAKELNPLIEAGRAEWEKYASQAPIVSDDKVKSLGEANDAIEDMNAHLETLKLEAMAELAPTIQVIADAMRDAAKAFSDYLSTEEGQAAINSLQTAITGLISDFTDLDFGALLSSAQESLNGIINGFADIIKDKDSIKKAFEAIGVGIVALRVAEAAANVAKLYNNLRLINIMSVSDKAGKAAEKTVEEVAKESTAGAAGKAATKTVGSAANLAGALLPNLGVGALFATSVVGLSKVIDERATQRINDVSDSTMQYAETAQEASGDIADLAEQLRVLNDLFTEEIGIEDALPMLDLERLREIAPDAALWGKLDMYGGLEGWLSSGEPVGAQASYMAEDMINHITSYIDDHGGDVQNALTGMQDAAISGALGPASQSAETYGANVTIGFANGIASRAEAAFGSARAVAKGVMSIFQSTFEFGSPSHVMRQLGVWTGEGFALGMEDTGDLVGKAAKEMMQGVAVAPEYISKQTIVPAPSNNNALLIEALSRMQVQIDGKDAGQILLPNIESLIAEQEFSRRYG